MPLPPYQTPYCLRCYGPLPPFTDASTHCPACGAINVHEDQRRFWTREKRWVELESLIKVVVSLIVAVLAGLILLNPGVGLGKGHGFAAGFPILVGALLWDAVSGLTRRRTLWNLGWFGALLCGVFGGPLTLLGALSWAAGSAEGRLLTLITAPVLLLACATGLTGRPWRRWRERYVTRQQAAHERGAPTAA